MFAFLAEHRGQLFPDEDYADLFTPGVGRPSLPATRMAAVLTLQALHDLSDRECAEAVRCDLRWKVACGLSLLDEGFDPSTLTYWRRRIATSERPHRINDAIRRVIEATGLLRGRRRRTVDSTIVDDAVATQDTVTQLIGAIRRVAREVPGAAAVIAAECTGHDYSKPGKPRIDWTDPEAKDALVSALVNDANAVVAALAGAELDERAEAVLALLALVAGQDVEPADGSDGRDGRWRIARRVAPERVISTVDPETRHTRKSQHNRKDGYRAHLVGEPETGLITDEQLTQAAGPDNADAAVAAQFLARAEPQASTPQDSEPRDSEPRDASCGGAADTAPVDGAADDEAGRKPGDEEVVWYGDSAYGTGDFREAIERAGTVTCPAGRTRPLSPSRAATFGALCRDCPLRARCTTSKTGRSLILHERDDLLRAARAVWVADPDLREDYRQHRPNVERTVAQVATRGGRRIKLRYRGTAKNNAWLKRRTAALNLRVLLGRGLARVNGAWVLAT